MFSFGIRLTVIFSSTQRLVLTSCRHSIDCQPSLIPRPAMAKNPSPFLFTSRSPFTVDVALGWLLTFSLHHVDRHFLFFILSTCTFPHPSPPLFRHFLDLAGTFQLAISNKTGVATCMVIANSWIDAKRQIGWPTNTTKNTANIEIK